MSCKYSAKVMSNVPSNVPYRENTWLDKLHLGTCYSAVGHEFHVKRNQQYIKVSLNGNT